MDLINRQTAIDFVDAEHLVNPNEKLYSDNDVVDLLKRFPAIDAVEVVRCKDCIYYEELNNNEHYCDAIYRNLYGDDEGIYFDPPQNYFCAYGIRRKINGSD